MGLGVLGGGIGCFRGVGLDVLGGGVGCFRGWGWVF